MPSQTFQALEELSLFRSNFAGLTGTPPFPWQEELYLRFFSQGKFPSSCNLPTGLGKTSVVAIWLIALAHYPEKSPRRLVYAVNRRTVVDQTTNEVARLRGKLEAACLFEPLSRLCALPLREGDVPLAISTLRGQFADNREWSADPARPAVVVGTVDMIGSRLLFSGYGVGFKAKPLHAAFLGQEVLLVHDEAHLEPAFQTLLEAISEEQNRCNEFRKFHLMALTATSRDGDRREAFELTEAEKKPPQDIVEPPTEPLHVVWQRLKAKKGLKFHSAKRREIATQIAALALKHKDSGKAILVFARTIEDVGTVKLALTDKKEQVQVLTGTLRGLERDRVVKNDPVFARFLRKSSAEEKAVYLICTSAGEVGIDISADHMLCDLTPLDSMMQRLGRVNRRGEVSAEVDLVHETDPDPKEKDNLFEKARWKTLEILDKLPACKWTDDGRVDASPLALRDLEVSAAERRAAFTPEPRILPASDMLFDSWALTTIRGRLPGRPPVEPYLHGIAEWEPRETYVGWRDEVDIITENLRDQYNPEDLLEEYPLKPHELLRDRSDRVFKELKKIAEQRPDAPVWLLDEDGKAESTTLSTLRNKGQIENCTVLLPPSAGGLEKGFLNGDSPAANDVADEWQDDKGNNRRARVWDEEPVPAGMRLIRTIDIRPYSEEAEESEESATARRYWRWCELARAGDSDGSKAAARAVEWRVHTDDVVRNATRIIERLPLSDALRNVIALAAKFHDLGKRRPLFQRIVGNMKTDILLAKSGRNGRVPHLPETYRHEFGSLLDVEGEAEFQKLSDEMKDLVLHLIAAHHGRARPHFPTDEAFDPERNGKDVSAISAEVPRRFARLQPKYGRWGLAYLESLLRAADYAASANPSAFVEDDH
jgi:CRISPR-associated endonuclease/helicase Cas3